MHKQLLIILPAFLLVFAFGSTGAMEVNLEPEERHGHDPQDDQIIFENLSKKDVDYYLEWMGSGIQKENLESSRILMNSDQTKEVWNDNFATYISLPGEEAKKIHPKIALHASFNLAEDRCSIEDCDGLHIYDVKTSHKIASFELNRFRFDKCYPCSTLVGNRYFVYAGDASIYVVDFSKVANEEEIKATKLLSSDRKVFEKYRCLTCINPEIFAYVHNEAVETKRRFSKDTVFLYNFATNSQSDVCSALEEQVWHIAGDGIARFAIARECEIVEVFEYQKNNICQKTHSLKHDERLSSVAFGPPGSHLLASVTACSLNPMLYFWDLETQKCIKKFQWKSYLRHSSIFWSKTGHSLQVVGPLQTEHYIDSDELKKFVSMYKWKKELEKREQHKPTNTTN